MPPKKSAAAVNAPTLKLVVEKGPLSGQTLDFRPGTRVNIGRLVRGNSIAIKDSGISSKHLRIELDAASDPDRRRWIITDLDSSNGTILNGEQLDPLEPATLTDGDLVKFGEETSIRVEFVVVGEENEAGSVNVRRNARRRVRGLDVIGEDAELGLRNSEDVEELAEIEAKQGRSVSTRRTRNSAKNENLADDLDVIGEDAELGLRNNEDVEKVAEIEAKQGKSVGTRRTRNSAKNENLVNDLGVSGIKGSVGVSTRRTRNSKKEENVDEIVVDVSEIEVKKPGVRGRGRKKQPVETISEEIEKDKPKSSHKACEEEKERSEVAVDESEAEVKNPGTDGVAAGLATSSGVKECKVAVDVSVIEGKKPGGRGRGRKKQPVEPIFEEIENEEPKSSHKACEEEKERPEVTVDELEAEVENPGTDGVAAGLASSSGIKECNVADAGKEKILPDLEKMTLGEWFEYIEVHETQYIIDKSEEMLAEMRRKAERCHEYMLQQKRLRG